jgi:hypothetical protein
MTISMAPVIAIGLVLAAAVTGLVALAPAEKRTSSDVRAGVRHHRTAIRPSGLFR